MENQEAKDSPIQELENEYTVNHLMFTLFLDDTVYHKVSRYNNRGITDSLLAMLRHMLPKIWLSGSVPCVWVAMLEKDPYYSTRMIRLKGT